MGKIQDMIDYAVNVANDDSRGYSQYRRWPEEGTDFDCSSLMYEAADHAGYPVKRGWPRYTGSMLDDFTAAEFTAIPFDGNLSDLTPGDIMLNVANHTEMYIGDGLFVGAHSSETGGIDGAPGDQTGNEISIVGAYNYPWDYVLVPPRDASPAPEPALSPAPSPTPDPKPYEDNGPKFCVCNANGWLDPMIGTRDTGGSSDDFGGEYGLPMTYIAIDGVGEYRVCTQANGWLPWVSKYDPNDLEYGCAGDGSAIIALEIPNGDVRYALHNLGGLWNDDMIGNHDTSGSSDCFAGAMVPADAARIVWA